MTVGHAPRTRLLMLCRSSRRRTLYEGGQLVRLVLLVVIVGVVIVIVIVIVVVVV